jgi:VanZ like family/Polymorphic toxin system, DSP-PTPase phosphatase
MQLPFLIRSRTWLLVALAIAAAIFVESSRPTPSIGSAFLGNLASILAHIVLFCALAYSLVRAHGSQRLPAAVILAIVAVAYGVSDEIHQSFVAGRDSNLSDVGLDAIGASLGAILAFRHLTLSSRTASTELRGEQALHWATSDLAFWREPDVTEWAKIRAAGVDFVLDLRAEGRDESPSAESQQLGYRRIQIVEFTAPTLEVLTEAATFAYEQLSAGKHVLVCCREGRGRSPMVCCATLVLMGTPLPSAYRLVQRVQPMLSLSGEQAKVLEEFARGRFTGTAPQAAT